MGIAVLVAALIAALAISQSSPQSAAAAPATPVLEFVAPSFPVPFTAEGGEVTAVLTGFDTVVHCEDSSGSGELTGPRTAVSEYAFTGCETQGGSSFGLDCKSAGAEPNEIRSGQIEAELVFVNQFTHQVGMLLDPHGGVYLSFKCGAQEVKAIGPFLSPVGPIDQVSQTFTATLTRVNSTQVPDQYEGPTGGPIAAVPTGELNGGPPASTGVELGFNVRTAMPIEVRALSSGDLELARLKDELAAAVRQRQEDAARVAAEKKAQEEASATAAERRQREEQALAREREQKRAKALRRCRKLKPSRARRRCEAQAKKKYGGANPIATASG